MIWDPPSLILHSPHQALASSSEAVGELMAPLTTGSLLNTLTLLPLPRRLCFHLSVRVTHQPMDGPSHRPTKDPVTI